MAKKKTKKAPKAKAAEKPPAEPPKPPEPPKADEPKAVAPKAEVKGKKKPESYVEGMHSTYSKKVLESREVLKHPCPAGMRFFEAPDGLIIVGEKERPFMLDKRDPNNVMQINPRREPDPSELE